MGSQAGMEVSELKATEHQRINIQLPQFPGYNTFNSHTQSPCYTNDSLLDEEFYYNSCRSLLTDHTGRSLDTLDVLSNGEVEEVHQPEDEDETNYIGEIEEPDVENNEEEEAHNEGNLAETEVTNNDACEGN